MGGNPPHLYYYYFPKEGSEEGAKRGFSLKAQLSAWHYLTNKGDEKVWSEIKYLMHNLL